MFLRFSSLTLAIGAALALASCSFGHRDDGSSPFEVISVAVGAEVTLVLDPYRCDESLVDACLSERPETLDGVSLSEDGRFELGEVVLDNGTVLVTVRALSAGDTVLLVNHADFRDRTTRDEIHLRAADITHVASRVSCDEDVPELPRYPITAGSELSLELTAMAGETPLASGRMELIEDSAGFEVLGEPGDVRQVRAPAAPGAYGWDLVGYGGLAFTIYQPADLELRLSEENGGVRVGRVIDDVPVCRHEGAARATLEVTQGACFPLVQSYEIAGKLPVNMEGGDFVLGLSGKDTCEVSASLDGGKATSLTLAVDNLPEPPQPGPGTQLGSEPLSLGGVPEERDVCPTITNLTDGACDILDDEGEIVLDADCLLDWDWVKDLYSMEVYSETPVEGGKVGQGLWVELHLGIRYEFLTVDFGTYSTNDLTFSSEPAENIEIESTGCIGSDRQVLAIRPGASGKFTLHLDADNVYEPSSFALSAAAIADVQYKTDAVDLKSFSGGTEDWWFVGSNTRVEVSYVGAGGAPLFGVAPLLVSSDVEGADASMYGTTIDVGTTATVVRLDSAAAPDSHLMHVVDESAIAGVGGVKDTSLGVGVGECLEAYATEPGGARIHGPSPIRPRVTIGGAAVVVDVQRLAPNGLCFSGYEPGTSDVAVTWGSASAQAGITVE